MRDNNGTGILTPSMRALEVSTSIRLATGYGFASSVYSKVFTQRVVKALPEA